MHTPVQHWPLLVHTDPVRRQQGPQSMPHEPQVSPLLHERSPQNGQIPQSMPQLPQVSPPLQERSPQKV